MDEDYELCSCGSSMLPVYFTEHERNSMNGKTGRVRSACSHLECDNCGKKVCIDDSFDEPWIWQRINP